MRCIRNDARGADIRFSQLKSDLFEKLAGADNADVSARSWRKVSLIARHDEIDCGRYGAGEKFVVVRIGRTQKELRRV